MRRLPSLIIILVLFALTAAGCGGESVEAEEVAGPPVTLELPKGGGEPADTAASSSDEDEDADADSTATPTPTAAATTGAGTTGGGGGAAATPAPTQAAPQTGGTQAEQPAAPNPGNTGGTEAQFDDFCQQNPGAC